MVKFQGLDSNQQPKGSPRSGKHATSESLWSYEFLLIPVIAPNRPIPVLLVQSWCKERVTYSFIPRTVILYQ
jgi:hypothetical protein